MFSYQTFLKEKNDLPFEKCQEYHQNILNAVKKGDSEFVQSVAFFGDKRLLSQPLYVFRTLFISKKIVIRLILLQCTEINKKKKTHIMRFSSVLIRIECLLNFCKHNVFAKFW